MMKKLLLITSISLLLFISLTACGTPNAEQSQEMPNKLRLGIIPSENAEETKKQFEPLVEYLQKTMGVEIEPFVATDYTSVIEAMKNKHIDAAMLGPFSYLLAEERANAELSVVRVGETGKSTYLSYIIARKDSNLKTIQDLAGKSFAFTDPASASGALIPMKEMLDNGLDPDKSFSNVTYTGAQDASVLAVKNGMVDAAAIDEMTYQRAIENGVISEEDVVIVHTSQPIPQSPFVVRTDLNDELKKKFESAMLKVHEEDPDSLKPLKAEKYVKGADSDYQLLRDTAKALNLDLSQLK